MPKGIAEGKLEAGNISHEDMLKQFPEYPTLHQQELARWQDFNSTPQAKSGSFNTRSFMNFFQKIGAVEAGMQHGLSPLQSCKCAGPEELLEKLIPLIDDASITGIRAARQRGDRKTRAKTIEEDQAAGFTLDKVATDSGYDLAKAIALTSILTGNLAGASYFFANRETQKEDLKNEALKRRIELYRNVSKELRDKFGPASEKVERASSGGGETAVPAGSTGSTFINRGEASRAPAVG
jgi:hypothetical protein